MQLYRHGSAGMMVPLVKAGAVGDGLSACRRYTMMGGGLCFTQHEEVSRWCSVSDDKKQIEWIFPET